MSNCVWFLIWFDYDLFLFAVWLVKDLRHFCFLFSSRVKTCWGNGTGARLWGCMERVHLQMCLLWTWRALALRMTICGREKHAEVNVRHVNQVNHWRFFVHPLYWVWNLVAVTNGLNIKQRLSTKDGCLWALQLLVAISAAFNGPGKRSRRTQCSVLQFLGGALNTTVVQHQSMSIVPLFVSCFFFMCFDILSNTMFGTLMVTFSLKHNFLIRGFCLSATTESGQSRWQPLLCSKLDAAGVQAVSTLRIDEKYRKMEQCFKTYCQGLARWGSVVHVFVDFGYLKISSWFRLRKLLVCALWFAALCCFARTSQHFGLPLALRHKTPHFHCLAEKVNTGPRLDKLWEIWMFLRLLTLFPIGSFLTRLCTFSPWHLEVMLSCPGNLAMAASRLQRHFQRHFAARVRSDCSALDEAEVGAPIWCLWFFICSTHIMHTSWFVAKGWCYTTHIKYIIYIISILYHISSNIF